MNADELIAQLDLQPHPEGGHYRELFRSPGDQRGACTTIYYLLRAGEHSHWHRVDADEIWCFHGGDPLELSIADEKERSTHVLGTGAKDHVFQAVVPANAWQSARPLGAFTLVSCIVAPAFLFERFELAPPGWSPD